MDKFQQILKLTQDETVELAEGFRELVNKELFLGQTRYVCRYGTLSPGHMHISDADRYYQAIREMYNIGLAVKAQEADAMDAEADLIDAKDGLHLAQTRPEKLRAEARFMKAQMRMTSCLVSVQDQLRQLDEYNKIRLELQDQVRAQYPEGKEQAEADSWKKKYKFQAALRQSGQNTIPMHHLPLPKEDHARLGVETGCFETTAWEVMENEDQVKRLGGAQSYLQQKYLDQQPLLIREK